MVRYFFCGRIGPVDSLKDVTERIVGVRVWVGTRREDFFKSFLHGFS